MFKFTEVKKLSLGVGITLLVILLLGTFLRLYALDQESLWSDETFSLHHAQEKSLQSLIEDVSLTEAAPPGYYLFLHYWILFFGDSEFSLRFPSVVFSLLSIFLLFLLVRLFFDDKIAWLSSLFMATSMLQVLFSQEARLYSLFTFLSLLTVYFFARLYLQEKEKQPGRKYYWLYFLTLLFSLYVNYLALFLMILFSLFLLWNWESTKLFFRKWAGINLLALIFSLPLLPVLQKQFFSLNAGLSSTLVRKSLPAFLAKLGLVFYALPLLFFFIVLVVLFSFRKKIQVSLLEKPAGEFFFFALFLFGAVYTYLCFFPLSLGNIIITRYPLTHSFFIIRHSYFLVPLLYVFLAVKISSFRFKRWFILAVIFLLLVNGLALWTYYDTPTKAEWKEMARFIQGHSHFKPQPLILIDKGGFSNQFLLEYYYRSAFSLVELTKVETGRVRQELPPAQILEAVKDSPGFWLILSQNYRSEEDYKKIFNNEFKEVLSQDFSQIKVYYFVPQ